jgi:diaminopimelate epimerase
MTHQTIKFTKMHGLGNDFIVIDTISTSPPPLTDLLIQTLSHRQTGIGFDQLLLLSSSHHADVTCRFFNADGSEAEQCGNGVRCVARYIHETKLVHNNTVKIETKAGIVDITIHNYEHIEVTLGIPQIESDQHILLGKNKEYTLSVLSKGNPHAIIVVPSVQEFPVREIGEQIATHPLFPKGVNVGFMEIISREKIRLRTYERGVGETFSCGSNTCAAVAAGIQKKLLNDYVSVTQALGQLEVRWKGAGYPVVMTGPATKVFSGEYAP